MECILVALVPVIVLGAGLALSVVTIQRSVDRGKKNSPGSARSTAPVLHTAALLGVPELVVFASVASFQMAHDGV